MTKERISQLPDKTLLSLIHSASGDEFKMMADELKKRGYVCKGFYFEKDNK